MKPSVPIVKRNIVVTDDLIHHSTRGKGEHAVCSTIISTDKHWLLVAFIFLITTCSVPAYGTAISVLVFHDKIVVAADSKVGREVAAQCKVNLINGWLFLAAGNVLVNSFDVLDSARSIFRLNKTPVQSMAALRASILKDLPHVIALTRVHNAEEYTRWVSGKPIVSIAIGAIEEGGPTERACEFYLGIADTVRTPNCKVYASRAGYVRWIGLGHSDLMKSANDRDPILASQIMENDPIGFVRGGVNLEMQADRVHIGPPITTAIFDGAGLHLEDPGVCKKTEGNKK